MSYQIENLAKQLYDEGYSKDDLTNWNRAKEIIESRCKSNKLIEVKSSKLILNPEISNLENTKVISIIGDARKGKSTFLNCIVNYLTNENKEYFKVQSSLEHCTIGMDYLRINVKGQDYLFIDCQGLNYEKSSEDSKYLLFLYSISNIIIFNDMNIINNNIFTTLQPMALFVNNFEELTDHKCVLYLRIADYDLEEDSSILKDKLFTLQNDQYDNVRKSILRLFNEIYVCNTLSLDRSEKTNLKQGNYTAILSNYENKFKMIIETIISNVESLDNITIDVNKLVDYINSNKKIDHKKLDVYTLYTEKEINEFIEDNIYRNEDLDFITFEEIKQPFSIDGMQTTRINLLDIKEELNLIKEEFEKCFAKVPENLKNIFYLKISDYFEFINSLLESNSKLGDILIKPNLDKIKDKFILDITDRNLTIINDGLEACYFDDINDLLSTQIIYDEISYLKFTEELDDVIKKYDKLQLKCVDYNLNNIEKIKEKFDSIKFDITKLINNLTIESCYKGNYKDFLISNNPYADINLDEFKFKKISSDIEIVDYTNSTLIKHIKLDYLQSYIELGVNYNKDFVSKVKELLSKTYFEKQPEITNKNIYFVKITLLSNPIKPIDVWVELDYLQKCIGISNKVFNYYSKFYKKKSNYLDWTLMNKIITKEHKIRIPKNPTAINPMNYEETKINGFELNIPFENPVINKWLIELQLRVIEDDKLFSKKREEINKLLKD